MPHPPSASRDEQLIDHDEDQFLHSGNSFVVGSKALRVQGNSAQVRPQPALTAQESCQLLVPWMLLCTASPRRARNVTADGLWLTPLPPVQLVDLRTGKATMLGGTKADLIDSIATVVDTQMLVNQMQSHLGWSNKGGGGH